MRHVSPALVSASCSVMYRVSGIRHCPAQDLRRDAHGSEAASWHAHLQRSEIQSGLASIHPVHEAFEEHES